MPEKKITIEVQVKKTVELDLSIDDIVESLNTLSQVRQWGVIGTLLSVIEPDMDELTPDQKELITNYFKRQLKRLS
jgi:hypothetical protein